MSDTSLPVRVRAYAVIGQENNYSKVSGARGRRECTKFGTISFSCGYGPSVNGPDLDELDAWNVLNHLREIAREFVRFPEDYWLPLPAGSIDAAVSQFSAEFQKLQERFPLPDHSALDIEEPDSETPEIRPVAMMAPSDSAHDEPFEGSMQRVRSFAAGKQLKWKQMGFTPSGRRCEVLTFDGSEEVLLSENSLEIVKGQEKTGSV